jgi:hypothetical protein
MPTMPTGQICAYCGVMARPITRDHVVPKALWKDKPLPPAVITVPSCPECQKEWDRDATYFRNLIVLASDPSDHPAVAELANGPIKRSVHRREGKRDYADITRNAVRGFHRFGTSMLEPSVRIDIDSQRFDRTPEKIVRGLFFFRNGVPVPRNYEVRIFPGSGFWQAPEFQDILTVMEPWKGMGDNVFAMRATRLAHDTNITFWLMRFYNSSGILGYTWPGDPAEARVGECARGAVC